MASNAGFEIIAEAALPQPEETEVVYGVALGIKQTTFSPEWVTWEWSEYPGYARSYFWGHYFRNELDAYSDYRSRVVKVFKEA